MKTAAIRFIRFCAALLVLGSGSASAQKTRSSLTVIYNSSTMPRHYRRAAAKALRTAAPTFGPENPTTTRTVTWTTTRGVQSLVLTCFGIGGSCRRFVLRGVPAGAIGSVTNKSGAMVTTLTTDSRGFLAWDGTARSGSVPPGSYSVTVQGAGGSGTFAVELR